eukprot:SM000033S12355  [mRNA]  locus=s33:466894:467245:+ [translate_table: standard]
MVSRCLQGASLAVYAMAPMEKHPALDLARYRRSRQSVSARCPPGGATGGARLELLVWMRRPRKEAILTLQVAAHLYDTI